MIGIGATVLAVEGRACPRCEEPLTLRIVAGTPEFVGKHKDSEAHHFTWPASLWGGQYQGCLTYACLNRKSGAKVNNLHDLFASWDVDIIAVGHGHDRMIAPPFTTLYMAQNGELAKRRRYALMTGAYLKNHEQGVTCYASDKGYRSADLGAVRLLYKPNRHELIGEI